MYVLLLHNICYIIYKYNTVNEIQYSIDAIDTIKACFTALLFAHIDI